MSAPSQFAYCEHCRKLFDARALRDVKHVTIDKKAEEPADRYKMTGKCPSCGDQAESLRHFDNQKCIKAFNNAESICNDLNGSSSEQLYSKAFALGIMMQHRQLQGYCGLLLLNTVRALGKMGADTDVRNAGIVRLCKLASEPLEKDLGSL